MKRYELCFFGSAMAAYFPRYRRWHATRADADATALRVYQRLESEGLPTACHAAIVYGPFGTIGPRD